MPNNRSANPNNSDQRDRVIRRLVSLLSLTQDMKRNEEDDGFSSDSENEIIYCVDTGVLESFLNPLGNYGSFETFHTREWTTEWASNKGAWSSISAQSTFVGSDWLLSGKLPGQKRDRLYMSEWHYREFFNRYKSHRDEIEAVLKDDDALDEAQQKFLRAVKSIETSHEQNNVKATDHILSYSVGTPFLREDVEELRQRGLDEEVILRFALARAAAALLADDSKLVRAQNLKSFYDPRTASRISALHSLFAPSNQNEKNQIKSLGDEWFRVLYKERERRSQELEGADERSDRSLSNDANTLAYITWISRSRLAPHQRIVLITGGDELLINAYRDWHIKQSIGEPILVRRATQFAPVINLNASPNDIENARPLFHQTRSAVEVTLAPLNMAIPIENLKSKRVQKIDSWRLRFSDNNRLFLAWRLAYRKNPSQYEVLNDFFRVFTDEWVASQLDKFSALRKQWQRLERFTIGAAYDRLSARLSELRETKSLLTGMTNRELARDRFVGYLSSLLEDINKQSIKLWFPLARDFVRAAPQRKVLSKRPKSRVPIALQLQTPAKTKNPTYDLFSVIEAWVLEDGKDRSEVDEIFYWAHNRGHVNTDILFALASTLALRLGFWSDAESFADLAISSIGGRQGVEGLDERERENLHEYIYLAALSKRLGLGHLNPGDHNIHHGLWRKELSAIVAETEQAQIYHEARSIDPRHAVRAIRSYSERAAARIFYVTWYILGEGKLRTTQDRFPGWQKELRSAHEDMRIGLEYVDRVAQSANIPNDLTDTLLRLEKQLVANVAASRVIQWLSSFRSLSEADSIATPRDIVFQCLAGIDRLGLADVDTTDMPSATLVDVLTFLQIEKQEDNYKEVRKAVHANEPFRLPIDRALFSMVLDRLERSN